MPVFNLIINKDRLYVWLQVNGDRKAEYFEGKPYFTYSSSRVREDMDKLEKILMNNNSLASRDDIKFDVVFSGNKSLNMAFEKALDGKIASSSDLYVILKKIMHRLNDTPELYIDKFGINYDGYCYMMRDGQLMVEDFSLLAYTLTSADILMQQGI